MKIQNAVSSKSFNTFGIDLAFECLISIDQKTDLDYLDLDKPFKILGGGSNILLSCGQPLPVVHINTRGKEIIQESDSYVLVKFSAGENWHDAVMWAVENNYGGIENLSLIPGKCGAAPMQNIGAYGIEIKDVLLAVYAFDTEKKQEFIFHNHECGFGYRTSNFKTIWKDKFIITEIVLKLTKPGYHIIDKSYGAIQSELDARGIGSPSIKDLSDVVIHIRQSKLPDPQELGNAGSFFKNPVISTSKFEALKSSFPEMPHYPAQDKIKLPAGWLIDQCGWKGITEGQVGTYKHQALVLVNHGQASGEDVLNFSKKINASVEEKFGVELEMEVNVW